MYNITMYENEIYRAINQEGTRRCRRRRGKGLKTAGLLSKFEITLANLQMQIAGGGRVYAFCDYKFPL